MRTKKKVLLLGPAHPYRGGIADTQNYLAQNISRLGHEVLVFTFKYQYPKLLFPGKTQYSSILAPKGINIKRKVHSINPLNWLEILWDYYFLSFLHNLNFTYTQYLGYFILDWPISV